MQMPDSCLLSTVMCPPIELTYRALSYAPIPIPEFFVL